MKKILIFLAFLVPVSTFAQTGAVQGYCELGGTPSSTSGLNSSNYMQGVIPQCTVTVYLTGTTTLATIYKDATNTPQTNPFNATKISTSGTGKWIFWAATNAGLDVQMSAGIPPNTFPNPVTLTDIFPSSSFTPLTGVTQIIPGTAIGVSPSGGTGNVTVSNTGVTQIIPGTNITISPSGGTGAVTVNAATGAGSPLTTKGDVYGFSTTNARIPVGTNGTVLTADSTQALGVGWDPLVNSLNALTGAVTLVGDASVSVTPNSPLAGDIQLHATQTTGLLYPPNVSTALPSAAYYGAVSSTGVAWMELSGTGDIAQITQAGAVSILTPAGGNFSNQSQGSFDTSGNFWANAGTNVIELNAAGTQIQSFPVGAATYGMTLDQTGNIWVSYREPSSDVAVYSNTGTLLHTISAGYAEHLFTDTTGVIWATDYLTDNVYRMSASTFSLLTTTGIPNSSGTLYLAFDSLGRAWVTGTYASVSEVAANGSSVLATYLLPSEFQGGITGERFWGIAVDGNNNIWVTGSASPGSNLLVAVLNTTGTTLGVFYLAPPAVGAAGTGIVYGANHAWVGVSTPYIVTVFNDSLNSGAPAYPGGTFNASGDVVIPAQSTATSANNFNSYYAKWDSSFFSTTPTIDEWTANVVIGAGTTPTSTLTFTHPQGTTGTLGYSIPPIAPASGGPDCLQISTTGQITNTGSPCGSVSQGTATLISGTVTVTSASACTLSGTCVYHMNHCAPNASTAIGTLSIGTITAGTSFVINALSPTNTVLTGDLSTVCWSIN